MDKLATYRQMIGNQAIQIADLYAALAAEQAEAKAKIAMLEGEVAQAVTEGDTAPAVKNKPEAAGNR